MACTRSTHGFTIVEMAVVMFIISVLVAAIIGIVQPARTAAKKAVATADIRNLETALRQYERDFGVFPPESVSAAVSWYEISDGTNWQDGPTVSLSSPEALVFFLTSTFRKNSSSGNGVIRANVDAGPYFELKTKQRGTGPNGRFVFKDPFPHNQAYLYENNGDGDYVNDANGDGVADDSTYPRGPHNTASFDLYSFGPDGANQYGYNGKIGSITCDDINNW